MSYILYGGLFDPPHLGHLKIAEAAYKKVSPDKLIWIPSKSPPHRKVEGLDAISRVEMLKAWLNNRDEFSVSDVELDDRHSGYTVETVEYFRKQYPDKAIYLLMGSDEARNFKLWYKWEKILQISTVIVGMREEDADLPEELLKNAVILNNNVKSISSSHIRQNLHSGIPVDGLLDGFIIEYITEKGFYR